MTQKKVNENWAKNTPEYMKCLNNEKREAVGLKNPFEIYFSRKPNELIRKPLNKVSEKERTKSVSTGERMMKAHARKNLSITYNAGNKTFVRLIKNIASLVESGIVS